MRHLAAPGADPLPGDSELRTEWHFGPGERAAGAETWRNWGLDAESVALFLGARAEKRLPAQWFMELCGHLRASGRRVVLMGGPAERELLKGLTIPDGVVVAPELPLRSFAAAVVNARAVLTADTGPMHLCVAAGVPTVELFSHSETWRFGYAHLPGHVVLDTGGRHPQVHEAWSCPVRTLSRRPGLQRLGSKRIGSGHHPGPRPDSAPIRAARCSFSAACAWSIVVEPTPLHVALTVPPWRAPRGRHTACV